jgi:hypothetical protein
MVVILLKPGGLVGALAPAYRRVLTRLPGAERDRQRRARSLPEVTSVSPA